MSDPRDLLLHPIQPGQEDLVQEVVESDPGYAQRVTGYPPGAADAQSLLLMRPPDLPEEAKVVFGLWDGPDLLGVLDLLRGYPDATTAYLGLLLVRGDRQREGLGTRAHALLLDGLTAWPEIERVRLSVVATNAEQAAGFWRGLGYREVGEPVPYTYDHLETTAQHFELAL